MRQPTDGTEVADQTGVDDPNTTPWTPSIDQALANRLLAKLSQAERSLLLDQAELVELDRAMVLVRAGHALSHAYFPTNCMISLLATQPTARNFEVGQIGFEGVLGASSALGVTASAFDAVVTGAGPAWRAVRGCARRRGSHAPRSVRGGGGGRSASPPARAHAPSVACRSVAARAPVQDGAPAHDHAPALARRFARGCVQEREGRGCQLV